MERILEVGEGNPGALNVIKLLLDQGLPGAVCFASAYHMKLWGSKLWVAYKDYAGQDVNKLIGALIDQDETLLETVNAAVARGWCGDTVPAISLREAAGL